VRHISVYGPIIDSLYACFRFPICFLVLKPERLEVEDRGQISNFFDPTPAPVTCWKGRAKYLSQFYEFNLGPSVALIYFWRGAALLFRRLQSSCVSGKGQGVKRTPPDYCLAD